MTELYFSTVKILAQRPTHISAVATVLLITKTFTQREREREREREFRFQMVYCILAIGPYTNREREREKSKTYFTRERDTQPHLVAGRKAATNTRL